MSRRGPGVAPPLPRDMVRSLLSLVQLDVRSRQRRVVRAREVESWVPGSSHGAGSSRGQEASPFRQPKAVWAVAFACVISFMGIGLVDPILPALAQQLSATPAQVSLLFTSYLLITAVAMLVTGWVSSRIGAKATLVTGPGDHRRLRGAGGDVRLDRRDRRVPGRLGPRERPVHRHLARGDRRERVRRVRRRDHPLRDRPRRRDRPRAAGRRAARLGELARPVLRGRRPHGDRAGRDPRAAGQDPEARREDRAARPDQGAAPPQPRDDRRHGLRLQLGLLHPARVLALLDGRTSGRSASAACSPPGACSSRSSRCSVRPRWNGVSAPSASSTSCSGCWRSTCW